MENAVELFEEKARRATTPSELDEFLAFIPGTPRGVAIRVYLLFHASDPVQDLAQHSRVVAGMTVLNLDVGAFELEREYWRNGLRRTRGVFAILPSSVENVYRLASVCHTDFWNIAVKRYVRASYPSLVPVFFRQTELREALEGLQRELGANYRLVVRQFAMKEHRAKRDIGPMGRRYDSGTRWTDRSVGDAFDLAAERGQWYTSIAFDVQRLLRESQQFATVASSRLYKHGDLRFNRLYREFTGALLPILEEAANDRMNLFRHRGIKERGYEPSAPLEITYGENIFDRSEEITRFAEAIKSYPHATKAILHTNPYFYASVADFLDGSSFEIWALSPRRILIIPQAKASVSALERLTAYIFVRFREGRVGEYG